MMATVTTNLLTPTTMRSITQILESDECLKSLQSFDENGVINNEPPKEYIRSTRSGNTYINLDRKAWQGGLTTVLTPSKFDHRTILDDVQPQLVVEVKQEQMDLLPESIVQKNTHRMLTRSISRTIQGNNNTTTTCDSPKRLRSPSPVQKQPNKRKSSTRKAPSSGSRMMKMRQEKASMSTDEWEKLQVRRERNKEAAARCRKRRVDQTNDLQTDVDILQEKRRAMEQEIRQLQRERDELQYILQNHNCMTNGSNDIPLVVPQHFVAVKSEPVVVEPVNAPYVLPDQLALSQPNNKENKPKRPATLSFQPAGNSAVKTKIVQGVAIETPSNGLPSLSYDLLNSGFTPMSLFPTSVSGCSAQQRITEASPLLELNTPDCNSVSLVTL